MDRLPDLADIKLSSSLDLPRLAHGEAHVPEARGEFAIEGCIEMVWIMGFIKHFDVQLEDGSLYVGWVDSKTNEPVDDKEVKGRYERDRMSCFMLASVLSASATRPFYVFNLTLPFRT